MFIFATVPFLVILACIIIIVAAYLGTKLKFSFSIKVSFVFAWITSIVTMVLGFRAISASSSSTAGIGYLYLPVYALICAIICFVVSWAVITIIISLYLIFSKRRLQVNKERFRLGIFTLCIFMLCTAPFLIKRIRLRMITVDETRSFKNSIGMEMIYLTAGYYVSKYETRQSEFEQVMGYNPSTNNVDNHPVETVSVAEALEFCKKLTDIEKENRSSTSNFRYTLPKYQHWVEYYADAASDPHAITRAINRDATSMPVGSGDINRLGIYDLNGNVSEFFSGDYRNRPGILGASYYSRKPVSFHTKSFFGSYKDKSAHVGFRCILILLSEENNIIENDANSVRI